jgi:hypothetical protein
MPKWITIINSYDPIYGVRVFLGDLVEAKTQDEAQEWCEENGRGYLVVTDQIFIEEVD